MLKTPKLIVAILVLFLFTISFSLFLENATPLQKASIHYVPPLEFIKFISGTFQSFWADIFYIRGIMAITGDFKNKRERTFWVQENLEVATNLDPKLVQAYFFAGVVVPNDDEECIEKGIQFLKRGIQRSPTEWQLPYWIGFNYFQLGEYLKAIEYYKKASNLSDAPKFLKSIQPMHYYRAGRAGLGVIFLEGLLHSIKDPRQLEGMEIKLNWLKNIVELEKTVKKFSQIYGRPPKNLEELITEGFLEKVPEDPFLGGYFLDEESGMVRSSPKKPPYEE